MGSFNKFIALLEFPLSLLFQLVDQFENHLKMEGHHWSFLLKCMQLTKHQFDNYNLLLQKLVKELYNTENKYKPSLVILNKICNTFY